MLNDFDKLDHLIAMAASGSLEAEAKELENMDISSVSLSPAYCRKRAKMIRKHKHHRASAMPKSISVRIAAAIIIIAAVFTILISCMPGLGKAIYNAIVEWCDQYFTVRYESEQEQETAYSESSSVPDHIVEIHKPTNLHEGVREDVLLDNKIKYEADFYLQEQYLFSFSQSVLKPFRQYADNEDIDVTNTMINGNDAIAIEYKFQSEICILWNDKEYSYQMTSNVLDIHQLVQYAEMVK